MRCAPVVLLGVVAILAAPARATWSILAVDTATGEIAMGSATCLSQVDVEAITPVLLVGKGGGFVQAGISLDDRQIIWDQLKIGTAPADILALIAQADPQFSLRQIAIVDLEGRVAA